LPEDVEAQLRETERVFMDLVLFEIVERLVEVEKEGLRGSEWVKTRA
jgi:tRNA A58 N-methylase Trm61